MDSIIDSDEVKKVVLLINSFINLNYKVIIIIETSIILLYIIPSFFLSLRKYFSSAKGKENQKEKEKLKENQKEKEKEKEKVRNITSIRSNQTSASSTDYIKEGKEGKETQSPSESQAGRENNFSVKHKLEMEKLKNERKNRKKDIKQKKKFNVNSDFDEYDEDENQADWQIVKKGKVVECGQKSKKGI